MSHSIDVKLHFQSSIIRDVDLIHSDAAVPRVPKDKDIIRGDQCLCSVLTRTRGKVLHITIVALPFSLLREGLPIVSVPLELD